MERCITSILQGQRVFAEQEKKADGLENVVLRQDHVYSGEKNILMQWTLWMAFLNPPYPHPHKKSWSW